MTEFRIKSHPIIETTEDANILFFWQSKPFYARPNEMLSSALMANGVSVFSHHPVDGSAQGIFCANGQCSQCMVIADGIPVKSCMTPVKAGMCVEPAEGLPTLPQVSDNYSFVEPNIPVTKTDVLIIGAGPAGLSAAIELGKLGVDCLLIDDKDRLGGKLVLQTHRFFGSTEAVFAGSRGTEIAKKLESSVRALPSVKIWTRATAVGVFSDKVVGVFRDDQKYELVKPKVLLVATGAREKSLAFPGNTLPGIYGAGAFQTLVNRDLVKPCKNLFVIGGGNVGLIAAYHAIQAGIHVAGLVEAAPKCGGYKVHMDKLVRTGVPIYTSHTVLKAIGDEHVEQIIIAQVDKNFQPIKGTEKLYDCDTVLIAVGLDPVNEFYRRAKQLGFNVHAAGDAKAIAEASAAIFSGKIAGVNIARELGYETDADTQAWQSLEDVLSSRPGNIEKTKVDFPHEGMYPVMHCTQEIPCNPCSTVCPKQLIKVDKSDLRHLPYYASSSTGQCINCGRCVAVCPGLAVSIVDFRKQNGKALVSLPYEQDPEMIAVGNMIEVTNTDGISLGNYPITEIRKIAGFRDGTRVVTIETPAEIATEAAGFRIIKRDEPKPFLSEMELEEILDDDAFICRCERVTAGEIRKLIREGVRDINQIKAKTKASMGACGGKTCLNMIKRLFQSEGISLDEVIETPIRPVFVEVPLHILGNIKADKEETHD